jgi:hypothetical protein
LAENAQEFIFVHIPNKNTGDNPLRQKKFGRTTFFLGATPMDTSLFYLFVFYSIADIDSI